MTEWGCLSTSGGRSFLPAWRQTGIPTHQAAHTAMELENGPWSLQDGRECCEPSEWDAPGPSMGNVGAAAEPVAAVVPSQ